MTQPFRAFLARSPEAGAGTGFLAVFLFFAFATPETFLSNRSFSSILNSQAVPGIVAIGITLLMISGEFDLSVGSILGVSALTFLYATVNGIHILIAMCLGLFTGCLLGLINGLLLIWTGIPSFIVTLGTMLVFRAISLTAISGGRIVRYADYSRDSPVIHIPYWMLVLSCLGLCVLIAWMSYGAVQSRLSSVKGLDRFRSGLVVLILLIPIVLALYLLSLTLTHGADVDLPDSWGYVPLHYASVRGGNDLIEHLVSKGADLSAVSRLGQSVADLPRGGNGGYFNRPAYPETVELLQRMGAPLVAARVSRLVYDCNRPPSSPVRQRLRRWR